MEGVVGGGVDGQVEVFGVPLLWVVVTAVLALLLAAVVPLLSASAPHKAGVADKAVPATSSVPSVVLMGPSLAGKTALFHRLCTGSLPRTVVSLQLSSASATLSDGRSASVHVRIVDVPGNPRASGREGLRALLRDASTRVVVILADSTSKASIREAASELGSLLTSASFVESGAAVIVAGSRADVKGAADSGSLESAVEEELDNIRRSESTLSADADGGEGRESDRIALGGLSTSDSFSLKEDSPITVSFVTLSSTAETGPLAGQKGLRKLLVDSISGGR